MVHNGTLKALKKKRKWLIFRWKYTNISHFCADQGLMSTVVNLAYNPENGRS